MATHVSRAPRPRPGDRDAGAPTVAGVLLQPRPQGTRRKNRAGDVEARLRLRLGRLQRLVQPFAQHPELQGVEDLRDRVPVPRPPHEVVRCDVQRHVAHQLGQLPVAHHRRQVIAQRIPGLARHLVDPAHQLVEGAEVPDPLGRGLLPHPRDRRQVVARVAAQRGEVRVLGRGEAVLLLNRRRVHPPQVAHAPARVEHGHVRRDQLVGVPVAGDDQDLEPLRLGLRHQGRDHVVRLEPVELDPRDLQRVQHLMDQADLTLERLRCLRPARLVLRIRLGPERLARHVERDREMSRLLVPQRVDQHRGEAIHGVGRLPGGGGEVLHRQRVVGAVCQRVPVEQHEPRSGMRLRRHALDRRREP